VLQGGGKWELSISTQPPVMPELSKLSNSMQVHRYLDGDFKVAWIAGGKCLGGDDF
jgi:hypothetical protein